MGKIVVQARVWNIADEELIESQRKAPILIEALVDSGTTMLVLPEEVVRSLKLRLGRTVDARYADGRKDRKSIAIGVRLEIMGRQATCDAVVEREGTTPLIGQIPLEEMDLHLDPRNRRLLPNPDSPDIPRIDVMATV